AISFRVVGKGNDLDLSDVLSSSTFLSGPLQDGTCRKVVRLEVSVTWVSMKRRQADSRLTERVLARLLASLSQLAHVLPCRRSPRRSLSRFLTAAILFWSASTAGLVISDPSSNSSRRIAFKL